MKGIKNPIAICLLFISIHVNAQTRGMSWAEVQAKGEGELAFIICPQPGIIEQDAQGNLSGLAIEILKDFCSFIGEKYNHRIKLRFDGSERDFGKFLTRTRSSVNVMGVSNVTITAERQKEFKFTPPFLLNPVVFVTHRDCPFTSIESFKRVSNDYVAEVIKGSVHEQYMQQFKKTHAPNLEIRQSLSGRDVMDKIAKDPKIITVVDLTEYMEAVRDKYPVKTQNISVTSEIERLGFAMSLSSDWDGPWKEFLTESYRESSKFKKNIVETLGEPFFRLISRK